MQRCPFITFNPCQLPQSLGITLRLDDMELKLELCNNLEGWERVESGREVQEEGDICMKVKVKSLSHVRLFATPRTVAYQAPLSMGFSRQEYWSGLPFPSPVSQLTVQH